MMDATTSMIFCSGINPQDKWTMISQWVHYVEAHLLGNIRNY